jgi:hypothetical protein
MSLIFLVTWPNLAYGQDNTPSETDAGDYTIVKEGQRVPFTGYLFDSQGVIKLINNKVLELQQLKITKDAELHKLNIELESIKKQNELEVRINKELNNNIIRIKDDKIKELEDSKKWDDVKLLGALTLGMVLSVTVFFAAVQIKK